MLFGRKVIVEIGPEGGVGVRLPDLRVAFRCEHKASKSANTATIKIWNPSPTSIGRLRVPLTVLRLIVGYPPGERLIFQGSPVKGGITLHVDGPDRVLEVDLADGGRAYTSTFLQLAFATGSTFGQVLAQVLAQTRWARGFVDPSVESVSLPHGAALTGRPAEVLDRLAAAVPVPGADWFVRDNAVYIVRRGQTTPEVAPLLSSTQGNLIGSPTQTKDGVKVRALIDATMRPGMRFDVQSVGLNGSYVARDVVFDGDSGWDAPFYMDVSGKTLGTP
ncbi:MAG TPA: hypothetical protein VFW27_15340 [Actinoplanes sp.]|nr:hypothetical protein [Actinoplanes sp.]